MADFIPSNLKTAQAILLSKFKDAELRFREPVILKSLLSGGEIMLPGAASLRAREDRPVEASYIARTARALGGARSHNHVGTIGDSAILSPSWTIYEDKFASSLKRSDNNVLDAGRALAGNLENVFANMAEGIESAAASFLFSSRSAVNASTVQGTFNGANDAFEIAGADLDRAIQITKTNMGINKYNGVYNYYCNSVAFDQFEKQSAQGSGNSTNLQFQFNNVNFINSIEMNALAAGLGYLNGFWIAVPVGMVSALPWIPKQNVKGITTTVNNYSTILNPNDGLSYGLHTYEQRADTSLTNGQTQDVTTEFQASIDIAFDHAPLTSGAGETPIFAQAIV